MGTMTVPEVARLGDCFVFGVGVPCLSDHRRPLKRKGETARSRQKGRAAARGDSTPGVPGGAALANVDTKVGTPAPAFVLFPGATRADIFQDRADHLSTVVSSKFVSVTYFRKVT